MVAEEQVKDLLKRDQDRENHLRNLQDNCHKYEAALRQVYTHARPRSLLLLLFIFHVLFFLVLKEWLDKEKSYMEDIQSRDAKVTKLKSRNSQLESEFSAQNLQIAKVTTQIASLEQLLEDEKNRTQVLADRERKEREVQAARSRDKAREDLDQLEKDHLVDRRRMEKTIEELERALAKSKEKIAGVRDEMRTEASKHRMEKEDLSKQEHEEKVRSIKMSAAAASI